MITASEIKESFPKEKYKEDAIWARYTMRRPSFYLTALAIRMNVTANVVSFIAMIVLIIGLLFFLRAGFLSSVLGAILLNLYIMLDCVDGSIARFAHQQSPYGAFIETINGYLINGFSFVFIGWAAESAYRPILGFEPSYIMMGALAGISNLVIRLVNLKAVSIFKKDAEEAASSGKIGFAKRIDKEMGIAGFFLPLILMASLFNMLHVLTVFYFLFYTLSMVVYLLAVLKCHGHPKNEILS